MTSTAPATPAPTGQESVHLRSSGRSDQLRAGFAFAILASVLIDIAVQMNVWRVVGVSGRRAQDL